MHVVRFEATHDMVALVVAVAAVWWLLTRPPTPPEKVAAQQPTPRRADRDNEQTEGSEKVTELRPASRAASA